MKFAATTSASSNRGVVESDLREVVGRLKRTMRKLDVANNIYVRLEKLDKRWREGLAGESAWHRLDGLGQRLEQLRRDSDKAVRDCSVARGGGGGGSSCSADGSAPGFSSSGDSSENSEVQTDFSGRFQRGGAAAAAAASASKAWHRPGRANGRDSTPAPAMKPQEAHGRYGNPDGGRASSGSGGAGEEDCDEESPAEPEPSIIHRVDGRGVVGGSRGGVGDTAGRGTRRESGSRGKKRARKGSSSGSERRQRAASSARPRDDARRVGSSGGVGNGGGGGFGDRARGRASSEKEKPGHDEPYLLGLDYSMAAASDEDGVRRGDPRMSDSSLSSLARSSSPSSSSSSSRSRSPLPPRQEGARRRGKSGGGGKRGGGSKAVRSSTSGGVHRRTSSPRNHRKDAGRKVGGGGESGGALVNTAADGGSGKHRRGTGRRGGGSGAVAGSATARSGARSSSSLLVANHASRDGFSGRSGPHAGSRPRFEIDGRALMADLYRRRLAQQEARGGAQSYRTQAPVRIDASARAAHAQDAEHAAQREKGGQLPESGTGRIPSVPPRLPSLVEDLVAKPRSDRTALKFTTMGAVSVFVCVPVSQRVTLVSSCALSSQQCCPGLTREFCVCGCV